MATCYVVINENNVQDRVEFVTANYSDIREWEIECGYEEYEDYIVEELPVGKADVKAWAEQLKMKVN